MVSPGTSDQYVDHYGLLRTLEAMYALPPLGKAADEKPLSGIWRTTGG
jgi:acid phosphatase